MIEITPNWIGLSAKQPVAWLRVTNQGNTNIFLQIEVVHWTQHDSEDRYRPSHAISITPALLELPEHKTRLLRFELKETEESNVQQTYRVYIKQILDHVHFALHLSLPLFVQPSIMHEQFAWTAQWIDDQHLIVQLNNTGNVTLFTDTWQLFTKDHEPLLNEQEAFNYILPNEHRSWMVTLQSHQKITPMEIDATINAQTVNTELKIL